MGEFIQHRGAKRRLEDALVGAGLKGLGGVVAEVRLKDPGGRDRQEILIDQRRRGDRAPGQQGLEIGIRVNGPAGDRGIGEIAQALAPDRVPVVGEGGKVVSSAAMYAAAFEPSAAGRAMARLSFSSRSYSARPLGVRAMPRCSISPKRAV